MLQQQRKIDRRVEHESEMDRIRNRIEVVVVVG